MVRVTVRFAKPRDSERFLDYYFHKHLPVGLSMPGIAASGVQCDLKTRRMFTVIEFADEEALVRGFASRAGQDAFWDTPRLLRFLPVPPLITMQGLQHPLRTSLRLMKTGLLYLVRAYS